MNGDHQLGYDSHIRPEELEQEVGEGVDVRDIKELKLVGLGNW